ncbi:hypothetical protein KI387_017110, partial [Taxus chinensis]
AYAREQTLRVEKIAAEHNGSDFVFVESPEEKENLWKMRKEALYADLAMEPENEAMTTERSLSLVYVVLSPPPYLISSSAGVPISVANGADSVVSMAGPQAL